MIFNKFKLLYRDFIVRDSEFSEFSTFITKNWSSQSLQDMRDWNLDFFFIAMRNTSNMTIPSNTASII